jgi:hypothetical protein
MQGNETMNHKVCNVISGRIQGIKGHRQKVDIWIMIASGDKPSVNPERGMAALQDFLQTRVLTVAAPWICISKKKNDMIAVPFVHWLDPHTTYGAQQVLLFASKRLRSRLIFQVPSILS